MEDLTYDRVLELAREVVEEFGADYVYPESHKRLQWDDESQGDRNPLQCVYVHEGAPSCIAGQILHRHGVSIEDLAAEEFDAAAPIAYKLANASQRVQDFLNELQNKQDRGKPWGESLEAGIKLINVYY